MSDSIPKLKKGMKALTYAKQGPYFSPAWAVMSSRTFPQHGEAFKLAADMILDAHDSARSRSHNDKLVFPVLYLYRHCLELKLKDLVLLGVITELFRLEEVLEILGEHELCPLWTKAKTVLLDGKPTTEEAQAAEAIIQEFHQIDKYGQTLRYDRKKKTLAPEQYKHLPTHISVRPLRKAMDALFHFLDSHHAGILDYWDAGQQAMD